ncbi:molybdopterin-dependent oxidoreductase [Microbacterium sp. NPDC078428]|uniref:molybdopterin-dependent oxidoreductase n=1 Tax=Microbacterium sp. NPDC078428 TaxID=3364190 RepID=UPI0037CC7CD9
MATAVEARTDAPRRAPGGIGSAVAGIVAAATGTALGELTAAIFAPESSPFAAIGGFLIDTAPPWAKDAAIALFGTADKIALLIGIALVLLAVSAGAGLLERVRPPSGRVVLALLGIAGVAAALSRANAPTGAWIPSAVAAAASVLLLSVLVRRSDPLLGPTEDASRRRFLITAGIAAGVTIAAAIGATAVRAGRSAASAVREAIRLPVPAAAAPEVPAGAELGIDGLAPVVTPNAQFYRIDTALVVPDIAPADWSLRIHGLVDREIVLRWDELLALPLEESHTTLACVSNEVGGDLIGTALWLGYPIRELLARAGVQEDADMVLSRSIDGFTASSPLEALTDDRNAILAVGMNGEPLPAEHGFPVRMVVPGLYGYVSATKWVTELEVTRFDRARAYWTDRGWSERGPVKLQSRIDVPRRGAAVDAGNRVIAGVAWQQHTGVAGVEVQVDEGPWRSATLASAISDDTWVQWSIPWEATTGEHTVRCRATNAEGQTQTSERVGVVPDGATGWHEVSVSVR